MRFGIGSRLLKKMQGVSRLCFGTLLSYCDGNVGISFASLSIPFCLADPEEIEEGLAALFSQCLGSVRLTQ
jgi:hypothetical protein